MVKEEEEKETFVLTNGLLKLKASADFAGCLYYLGGDSTENQLGTSFPKIETKVFLENYTGGIRSFFLDDEFNFQKSKTHQESFKAEEADESFWKGVAFHYKAEKQEELKGILSETTFLTLPSSNIVKIRRKFVNPTSASFKFNNCLWMSPNVGGEFHENEVIFPRAKRTFHFKRAEGIAISPVDPGQGWLIVKNRSKQQSLGLIVGNTDKSTILSLDLGQTLLELLVISKVLLLPNATLEFEDYIVYSSEEVKLLEKLAKILQNMPIRE